VSSTWSCIEGPSPASSAPKRATGAASTSCARLSSGQRQGRLGPRLALPYEALDRLWKEVLLNQFHDILPGSSIAWVYAEAESAHTRIAAELETIISGAAQSLTQPAIREEVATALWALNTSPRPRREVALVPAALARLAPSSSQALSDGRRAAFVRVPASGAAALAPSPSESADVDVAPVWVERSDDEGGLRLDNGLVSVRLGRTARSSR